MAHKILLITDHHDYGGVESVHYNLAKGFQRSGHHPLLVSAFVDRVGNPIPENVGYIALSSASWERKLFIPYLLRLILFLRNHKDAALIISGKDHVNLFVVLAARLARFPGRVIVNSHTTVSKVMESGDWPGYGKVLALCKWIYPWGDIIANVSKGAARDAEQFFGLPKVYHLPNPAVDQMEERTLPNPFDHPERTNILACGRLNAAKNYPFMLRAFALAVQKKPDLHLTFLGDGERAANLKQLAGELGLQSAVTFKGFVSDPRHYMQHAACLWLTSTYEGFGVVLIEALVEGCPPLSVDCPHGPAEIIGDNDYGVLVNSYDDEEMAAALLDFLRQPKKPKSYYQNRAMDFSIEARSRKYLQVAGL